MPIPPFIVALREHIGHAPLWLLGTTAVILNEDAERVLLARRADTGHWSPISGIVEPGENPGSTARREALEEASVHVEVERLVEVTVTDQYEYPNGDRAQYLNHTFRCRYLSGEPRVGDDENLEVAWFDVHDLPVMSEEGRARIRVALLNEPETRFVS
ncbi:NUDIX domain-containing protein [Microbacteriaceae bacterium 4G12]